ncbi:uncharacterized protein LOC127790809 [Diospyros lotus]|uniref:uncharacterized protein LOC127790809 n=1 Tax=Diospyros lotus TaxID=55363 RepID=UPI002255B1EF|nr:uncharacterized protein LOC127790809 [Diospyros lotus]
MGKVEEEESSLSSSTAVDSQSSGRNGENGCRGIRRFVRFRCVLALVLGVGVLLSALFWLPPFLHYGDQGDLDLDSRFGDYDIIASFMLEKPVSLLEDNILRLEGDIFDEIEAPTAKVEVISLKPLDASNRTKVVFAVVPDEKNSRVSSTAQSLIRSGFVSLVTRQYPLRLTASLFGNPHSFDVLKFRGGITVIPPQNVFPLQKSQIIFNFTLNFSIDIIQDNFNALASQLKSGLRLASYENLYINLTNSRGSTVAPPTTIETAVVLLIGNPSLTRLKQLARTITGSHAKNLGLNNTVFGRVKQVRLSSILQHSLGGDASPSPSPLPHPHIHHHHHHHHRHHHHHELASPVGAPPASTPAPTPRFNAPSTGKHSLAPAPVPSPERSHIAKPPRCQFGQNRFPRKPIMQPPVVPPILPPIPPRNKAFSPSQQVNPPPPVPHQSHASSPLPNVGHTHHQPPKSSEVDAEPPDSIAPLVSPSLSSSSAGFVPSALWAVLQLLVLVFHL